MKQTAVEWLMQQLPTIDKYDPYYQNLFTQAKAMEKEQKGYSKEEVKTMLYNCVDVLEYNTKGLRNKDGLVNEIIETFKSE